MYLDGFAELLRDIGTASKLVRRMQEYRETISGDATSLVAALSVKSTATLAKRLCSLRLFFQWYRDSGRVGFTSVDISIFEYVSHLSTKSPASRAQGLREALAFARGAFEIDTAPLDSTRVRGAALQGLERKVMIRQRAHLSVEHARLLERVASDVDHADCLFASSCCLVVYGRARIGDWLRCESELQLDIAEATGLGFVEVVLDKFKTAKLGTKAGMPIAMLNCGVARGGWAQTWLARRCALAVDASIGFGLFLAPLVGGHW